MEFAGDNFGGDGRRGVGDAEDCKVCAVKRRKTANQMMAEQ